MNKYKILWIDDLFAPLTGNFEEESLRKCANFQQEIAQAKIDYPIEIDSIWDINQFPNYVPNIKQYQAVIFDLRGLNPDDSKDVLPMPKAFRQITDSGVLIYVFSSNIGDRDFNSSTELEELKQSGRCFSRIKGDFDNNRTAMQVLLDKIVADLESSLNFYEGHEDCLNIFNEGWLDSAKRSSMDSILSIYYDRNYENLPADDMRIIMEMIAHKLIEIKFLAADTQTKIKQWTKELSRCNPYREADGNIVKESNGKVKPNYDDPIIHFALCGKDVRVMMAHLALALDQENHYFKAISDNGVRQHIWSSVYDAFFVVIWWFDWFMKLFHEYNGDLVKYVEECCNKDVVAKMPTPSQTPLKKVWFKEGETYKGTLIFDRDDNTKMRVLVKGAPFPPKVDNCLSSNLKRGDEVTFVAHEIDSYWVATDVK